MWLLYDARKSITVTKHRRRSIFRLNTYWLLHRDICYKLMSSNWMIFHFFLFLFLSCLSLFTFFFLFLQHTVYMSYSFQWYESQSSFTSPPSVAKWARGIVLCEWSVSWSIYPVKSVVTKTCYWLKTSTES